MEVSTRGLQFNEAAAKLSKELSQKLIERLADLAWASAFYGAPWRTGKLAGSITKEVNDGGAEIQALAPYAVFVEKGSRPHEVRPVNASVVAFEARGKIVFTPIVKHPGTKPNPFMERAAEHARSKAESVFTELWQELTG